MKHVVETVCGICNAFCGLDIVLEAGRIAAVSGRKTHPYSGGRLCPKGKAAAELYHSKERLKRPLKKDERGRWSEISWDDALDITAERLAALKTGHGAESIAFHIGHALVRKDINHYIKAFAGVFGSNFSTCGSHCHLSKEIAATVTFGACPVPDYKNSSCIVLWGSNPASSLKPAARKILDSINNGARLIVIDPRRTFFAGRADIHLPVRPGSDGALALGMLNVIINERLYDEQFVRRWTIGFDKLVKLVREYTPENIQKITSVDADSIKRAAYLYAGSGPACISPGIALELQTNGFQTLRAISILQAVTSNLDIPGGALFPPLLGLTPLEYTRKKENKKPGIGEKEYPLFYRYHCAQANIFHKAVLKGEPYPLKGILVAGSNPVLTWPGTARVVEALRKLEFLAVVDHFMTATAELADIVLPTTPFWSENELWEISSHHGIPRVGLAARAVVEQGTVTDWELFQGLIKRLGYSPYFPWETSEQYYSYRLKKPRLTFERIARAPDGYRFAALKEKKYESRGFNTRSGKVEIYSGELAESGYDALPGYVEPYESPLSKPERSRSYPFIASTGSRETVYMHSRFRNNPSLCRLSPEPYVEIHGQKARQLDIADGETVIVQSPRGCIKIKARINNRIHPETAFIPHGWEQANANLLTDGENLDPVSGFPGSRAFLAAVKKIEK